MPLVLNPEHLGILQDILSRHLPPEAEVFVYGSRATGERIWRGSDLDLMIKAGGKLPFSVLGELAEEFSESLLPFMVDLHDWHRTGEDFLARITPDFVRLPMGEKNVLF